MKKLLIIILGITNFWGCAHMHIVSKDSSSSMLEEINKKAANSKVILSLKNGNSVSSKGLLITSDTTVTFEKNRKELRTIITTDINDITIVNKRHGLLDGAKIGYLSFASAGLLLALFQGDDYLVSTQQKILISFTVFGGIGSATGALLGFSFGRRDKYVFKNKINNDYRKGSAHETE